MIERQRLRKLAAIAGLSVTAVTTAEPFPELWPVLHQRIADGRLRGMDWFTEERALFSLTPRNLHPTGQSIISIGVPYWTPSITPPDDGIPRGRIARYAWGKDYHRTLRKRMEHLHALLEQELGRPVEARFLVDTARIVDRAVAARSGLGWYGKNTMIIVPHYGSWVMLGEMIVDIPIEPDPPLRPRCGRCTACLAACPTGALVGPYELDAPRCISYLTIEHRGVIPLELRPLMGNWVFGCDICQEACPYTIAARSTIDPDFLPEREEHCFPRLEWILRISEEEFRTVYRGRAVLRAKWAGFARNAAIALGNCGRPDDAAVLEEVLARHPHPLVRGHAAWALAQLGGQAALPTLRQALACEEDPYVRSELLTALDLTERHRTTAAHVDV